MADAKELRKEALEWLQKHGAPVMRSCWNCNPAHQHLKNADYVIWCPWCERMYYKGVDITNYVEEGETYG